MKLINKVYQITIPIILFIIISFSYIQYLELENRINEEFKRQIDSNIEKSLNLKNNPLFLSYFDYMEYGLEKEARITKESLKELFKTQFEINKLYGKHLIKISLLDVKLNDIVSLIDSEDEQIKDKISLEFDCIENRCKSLSSLNSKEYQVVNLLISNEDESLIERELIKGQLSVVYKIHNRTIDSLKSEFISQAILYNSILLVFLIALIIVIVKMIVNPIGVLNKKILNSSYLKRGELNTNIKEIKSLENAFLKYSLNNEKQKSEIIELNKDLEKKVEARTIELENAYKSITQYKHLFDQNKAIMLLIEPNSGKIIDANQSAINFYGYAYEDLILKNINEINISSENEIKTEIENAKKEKRNHFFFEHKLKDNSIKSVEVLSGPIMIENKNLLYSIIHDITEYKRQEQIITEQAKLASMGEMIGNIAHQWRQPLSVITTSASGIKMMAEYGQEVTFEKLSSTSDIIVAQAEYLSNTIDNFKNFIKGDTKLSVISVKELIENTSSLTDAVIKNNNITLIKDIPYDLNIYGSINVLSEAFINIINNSKDALCNNIDDADDRLIFIEIKKNSENVEIIFKDTAGGISEDILSRIFEPYFTSKHQSVGTGLGLYIAEKIIREQYKGSIIATNKEFTFGDKIYKGAEFKISLPLFEMDE